MARDAAANSANIDKATGVWDLDLLANSADIDKATGVLDLDLLFAYDWSVGLILRQSKSHDCLLEWILFVCQTIEYHAILCLFNNVLGQYFCD